jgi:hypothetical protein
MRILSPTIEKSEPTVVVIELVFGHAGELSLRSL